MKKEKVKLIIDGAIILSLFFAGTYMFLNTNSIATFNEDEPEYMKFNPPIEEKFYEDEYLQDHYLEDEDMQENKELEDFYKKYRKNLR